MNDLFIKYYQLMRLYEESHSIVRAGRIQNRMYREDEAKYIADILLLREALQDSLTSLGITHSIWIALILMPVPEEPVQLRETVQLGITGIQSLLCRGLLTFTDTPPISSSFFEGALRLADRREYFCKNAKPCPKCGTEQVQIVDWSEEAKWKCRHCKHKWTDTPVKLEKEKDNVQD